MNQPFRTLGFYPEKTGELKIRTSGSNYHRPHPSKQNHENAPRASYFDSIQKLQQSESKEITQEFIR